MNTALLQYLVPVKDFYCKVLSDYEFSYGQLVLFLASILIAKIVYEIVYNYYISPLSVIPGPRLCAISKLPVIRQRLGGRMFAWVSSLHKQYGPVVRITPNLISFADRDSVRHILVNNVSMRNVILTKSNNRCVISQPIDNKLAC